MGLRRFISAIVVAIVVIGSAAASFGSSAAAQRPGADAARPSVTSTTEPTPRLAPGRYGALRVGMTERQAVRTGLVRRVYVDEYCGHVLRFRRGYRAVLAQHPDTGRVLLVGTFRGGPNTTKGVHVGSTLREVRRAYGDALRGPRLNEYGQWAYWVRSRRAYLSFLLNGEEPRPSIRVGSIYASTGRPVTIFEGEGPC